MRHTKRMVAVAPVAVVIAALVTVGIGPNATAQDITPIDEASSLLADELNTVEVIDRFGDSVVAVSVSVTSTVLSSSASRALASSMGLIPPAVALGPMLTAMSAAMTMATGATATVRLVWRMSRFLSIRSFGLGV
ncbi:MAG: hypothetical protein R6W93_07715 [Candidatus Limnocylindrales bacterium]